MQNYKNPFNIEELQSQPATGHPGSATDYDKKVDELLQGGAELRRRMMMAEQNKDVELSAALEDLLQPSASHSGIFEVKPSVPAPSYQPRRNDAFDNDNFLKELQVAQQPRSKEAELERLRLGLSFPTEVPAARGPIAQNKPTAVQPSTLSYSDIKRHRLLIKNFKATNNLLIEKLKSKEVALEVIYPVLNISGPGVPNEVYKFLGDEDKRSFAFVFNQEIESELDLRKVGVQRVSGAKVKFIIWLKGGAQNKDAEICSGELSLEEVLMAPSFHFTGEVVMRIHIDPNQTERVKKVTVSKADLPTKLEVITSDAGLLNLEAQFFNPAIGAQHSVLPADPLLPPLPVMQEGVLTWRSPDPKQETKPAPRASDTLSDFGLNPICLFVHIRDARGILPPENPNVRRNIFVEHKTIGSTESLRSQVCWGTNSPVLDHRVAMPLTVASIKQTKQVPLVVSVWDKNLSQERLSAQSGAAEEGQDRLLGVCKVSLQSVYTLVGTAQPQELQAFLDKQGNSMMEILDQFIPIRSIATNQEVGWLNVCVCLGNVRQIKWYNQEHGTLTESQLDAAQQSKRGTAPKRKATFSSVGTNEEVQDTRSDIDGELLLDESLSESDPAIKPAKKPRRKQPEEPEGQMNQGKPTKPKGPEAGMQNPGSERSSPSNRPIMKKNDKDVVTDPKTGQAYQQTPEGDFIPLLPVVVTNEKGKTETVLVNPAAQPYLPSPKVPISKHDLVNMAQGIDFLLAAKNQESSKEGKHVPNSGSIGINSLFASPIGGVAARGLDWNPGVSPSPPMSVKDPQLLRKLSQLLVEKQKESKDSARQNQPNSLAEKLKPEGSIKGSTSPRKDTRFRPQFTYALGEDEATEEQDSSGDDDDGEFMMSRGKITQKKSDSGSNKHSKEKNSNRELSNPYENVYGKKKSAGSLKQDQPSMGGAGSDKQHSEGRNKGSKPIYEMEFMDDENEDNDSNEGPVLPRDPYPSAPLDRTNKSNKSLQGYQPDGSRAPKSQGGRDFSMKSIGLKEQGLEDESEVESQEMKGSRIPEGVDPDMSQPSLTKSKRSRLEDSKNLKIPMRFNSMNRVDDTYSNRNVGTSLQDQFVLNIQKLPGLEKLPEGQKKPSLPLDLLDGKFGTYSDLGSISKGRKKPQQQSMGVQAEDISEPSSFKMDRGQKFPRKFEDPKAQNEDQGQSVQPRAEIPQFLTILDEGFFSDDVLMNFTMLLEYLRRHVFMNEELSEKLDRLCLGNYQTNVAEAISFEDLESVVQNYMVIITKTELRILFDFLSDGSRNTLDLNEIHNSLLAFLPFYEHLNVRFYEGFKELYRRIKEKIDLDVFKNNLIENQQKYHVRNEYLQDYVENYLGVGDPLVCQTLFTSGEFIYMDSVYIFNSLNYLMFLEHYDGKELSMQYINSLHDYHKFVPLVEVKAVFHLYEAYKITAPNPGALEAAVHKKFEKVESTFPLQISFRKFEALLRELKLKETTVFENLLMFKQALETEQPNAAAVVTRTTEIMLTNAWKYIQKLLQDKRSSELDGADQNLIESARNMIAPKDKRRNNLVGEKFTYTYEVDLEKIEDLHLARCDYNDLSLMYQFPGEEEAVETQIFTYEPDLHEYDVAMHSRHSYTLLKKKGLVELFGKTNGLRIILTRQFKKVKEGIGLAIIPVDDLTNPSSEPRSYFIHPLNTDLAKKEHLGILFLHLTSIQARADLYADEMLASKADQNGVEKVLEVDRGIPTEGVFKVYTESMTKLTNIYSALETVVRDAFPADSTSDIRKTKISLFLEFRELSDKDPTAAVTPMNKYASSESFSNPPTSAGCVLEPFLVELDSQIVDSKLQAFRFIDKHTLKNHIINDWQNVPVKMDEKMFQNFSDNYLIISLFLQCTPQGSASTKTYKKLCGQAQIKLEVVLSSQNQEGYKASYGLLNEVREVVGYINCTLNYTKGRYERGDDLVQELKEDVSLKTESLKNLKISLRLCELISLRKSSLHNSTFAKNPDSANRAKAKLQIKLGSSTILKELDLLMPATTSPVTRVVFEQHLSACDYTIPLDIKDIEELLMNQSNLERVYNSKNLSDLSEVFPNIEITLKLGSGEDGSLQEEGKFDFPLGDILNMMLKATQKPLDTFKAYLPLLKGKDRFSNYKAETGGIYRLGIDLVLLNTDKLRNHNTLQDLFKLLDSPVLRSLKHFETKLAELGVYVSKDDAGLPIIDSQMVHKVLRSEFKMANSEIAEIIELFTNPGAHSKADVNIYKFITNPLIPELKSALAGLGAGATYMLDMDEILKNIKRTGFELYLANNLVQNSRPLVSKIYQIDNKFDYVVFLSQLFEKQITYDLSDLYSGDKFAQIQQDLNSIEALRDRIYGQTGGNGVKIGGLYHSITSEEHALPEHPETRPATEFHNTWGNDAWADTKQQLYTEKADTRVQPTKVMSAAVSGLQRDPIETSFVYEFTLLKGENLLKLTRSQLPNVFVKVIFSTYLGNNSQPTDKQYSSQVVTRSSNPEWNFTISFKLSELSEFYARNKNQEIIIELYHLEGSGTGQIEQELYLGSFYAALFGSISAQQVQSAISSKIPAQGYGEIVMLEHGFSEEEESSVALFVKICIKKTDSGRESGFNHSQSVENPFKQGMMVSPDLDDFNAVDEEALLKTKQTLDEIRKLTSHIRDDDLLENDVFAQRLKQTLGNSPNLHVEDHAEHGYPSSNPRMTDEINKPDSQNRVGHSQAASDHYQSRLPGFSPTIREASPSAEHMHPGTERLEQSHNAPDNTQLTAGHGYPSKAEDEVVDHPRNTPSFPEDRASGGENPFRRAGMLEESAEESQEKGHENEVVTGGRKERPVDRLMKGLKEKYPQGGLRSEDLERIERIFRTRKVDNKLFDTDDSDFD